MLKDKQALNIDETKHEMITKTAMKKRDQCSNECTVRNFLVFCFPSIFIIGISILDRLFS